MKQIIGLIVLAVIALAGFMGYRTATYEPPHIAKAEITAPDFDADMLAAELSAAIRFPTISNQDGSLDLVAFEGFWAWFDAQYPHVAAAERVDFGQGRLVFWRGSQPDLDPILVMGHIDVVPVIPGTEQQWKQAPFGGVIDGGFVWGRGAMDMKGPTVILSHILNKLMGEGFQPERTIIMAYHPDEEVGGPLGAQQMAAYLKDQGISPILSLDEGGLISRNLIPGVQKDAVMIGVSEKGYMTVEVVAKGRGGHSSMPGADTAVTKLAAAINRIRNTPFPAGIDGPVKLMYQTLAPELPGFQKFAVANLDILAPVVVAAMSAEPTANASMRTTIAPTMLSASVKENVLPIEAIATINLRLHPRDTIESALAHLRAAVSDPDIEVRLGKTGANGPSPVSDMEGPVWRVLSETAAGLYPDALVTPYLTVGATDSRHYMHVAQNTYRLSPFHVDEELRGGIHGTNERIAVDDLPDMARFYHAMLTRGSSADAFVE